MSLINLTAMKAKYYTDEYYGLTNTLIRLEKEIHNSASEGRTYYYIDYLPLESREQVFKELIEVGYEVEPGSDGWGSRISWGGK